MDAMTVIRLPMRPNGDPVRLVVNTLGKVDLGLTDLVHDGDGPRPYATAPNGKTVDVVTFCDELARGLLAGGDGARIVTRRQPEDLIARDAGGRWLRLAFFTPTHFRVAGIDHLLPDPFHVFGGLLERWRALGYPELEPPNLKRLGAVLERYALAEFPAQNRQSRRGFIGVLACDLLPLADTDRAALWTLARFAEWRGVGGHTSYGMGRTRLVRRADDRPAHVWAG